jgi:hypothetical protein
MIVTTYWFDQHVVKDLHVGEKAHGDAVQYGVKRETTESASDQVESNGRPDNDLVR